MFLNVENKFFQEQDEEELAFPEVKISNSQKCSSSNSATECSEKWAQEGEIFSCYKLQ